jgi:superfamily II DNA/RNA helicase
MPTRDELASLYLDQLPFDPYPVQEDALLAWFSHEQGVLVCAPTGMGKTIIAEAALFEALHTGKTAYYTTPLIALTEQKFREMQAAAVRWGFHPDDVGLVTGNRCVNPDAKVLVVVAEILLNRLLHQTQYEESTRAAGFIPAEGSSDGGDEPRRSPSHIAFDFSQVFAVVMDEFHSFADAERGVVWELSLGLLPKNVRLLLLSATVGNSAEFLIWLRNAHGRTVQLIQSFERKVPLVYEWVGDKLLNEHLEEMASERRGSSPPEDLPAGINPAARLGGDEGRRRTPALVFCFNREECWSVAEQMKGKSLLADGQQKKLLQQLDQHDWSQGAGPKLKPILLRGVGVHHAGMLPRYRRIVEELFQKKLLSICICTETLAAGINLPARSVVLTTLVKGPPGKKRLIDPSSAHQMFGRAGRPQFDARGFVYALAHEDDVKILRWKQKYDQIPEDTKDPNLIKAKKKLKKKAPSRRETETYWSEQQFQKLIESPPGKLYSKGPLPWRLLAYLLEISPDVERLRSFARKRLTDEKRLKAGERDLVSMLRSLDAGGYVTLDPPPPPPVPKNAAGPSVEPKPAEPAKPKLGTLGAFLQEAREKAGTAKPKSAKAGAKSDDDEHEPYTPKFAHPTPKLDRLLVFRSVNPLYGAFLIEHLGVADRDERLLALESVLETPGSMAKSLRVPKYEDMPPGPLATERLDPELIERGLVSAEQLKPRENPWNLPPEERWVPTLGDKLKMLFEAEYPGVRDVNVRPVWAAGELLKFGGDFNKYVTARNLTKQEGIVFRHVLRLILLCGEFAQLTPSELSDNEWQAEMADIADQLTAACRTVDPESTDKAIEAAKKAADVVKGEAGATSTVESEIAEDEDEFGVGLLDDD